MTESLLSHADLDELADGASTAAAEQLVAAAAAGRLTDPADTGYAYLLAVRIHVETGDFAEALALAERALDALEPGNVDPGVADQLLAARDRIRGGNAEDDAEVDTDDPELAEADGSEYPYPDPDPELAEPGGGGAGEPYDGAVLLIWPEAAYEEVDQRWPEVLEPTGAESWDEYREYCQAFIAEWVQRSRTPLLAVTGDADEFEEWLATNGADPYQSMVALAREYGDHLASAVDPVELPPEPDAPCWCGSGASYAECCRRLSRS